MNLSNFKVIPQSNITKAEPSLEDLKPLFVPEVVKPDLVYNEKTEKFFIPLKFIKEQTENQGFTAITDGISTYLIRTTKDDVNEDIRPKFFRGNKTQYATSDYLRLLTKDLGNDLFLHETKIEDYQAFLISNNKVNPFEKLQEVKEKWGEAIVKGVEFHKSVENALNSPELPFYQTQIDTYSQLVGNVDTIIVPTVSESVNTVSNFEGFPTTSTAFRNEETPFTYTSDLLDQPVEENVEEPSLF